MSVLTGYVSAGSSQAASDSGATELAMVPGGMKVQFSDGVQTKDVDIFIANYRIIPVGPEFKYDVESLQKGSSATLRLWKRSAAPPAPQWMNLLVPFGQEQRWIEVFSSNPVVKSARQLRYDSDLGVSNTPTSKPPSAKPGRFRLRTEGKADDVLPKVLAFLKRRFHSKLAKVWGESADETDGAVSLDRLRETFHADDVINEVSPCGWQCFVIDVALLTKDGHNYLDVVVDGKCGYGMTTGLAKPPQLDDYEPMLPKLQEALHQFSGLLREQMAQGIDATVDKQIGGFTPMP